ETLRLLQDILELLEALVRIDANGRATLPGAVNDARMVELVQDDGVAFADQRRDGADVRGVAAAEHDGGFLVFELCELLLELPVRFEVAGHQPRSTSANPVLFHGLDAGTFQSR